MDERLKNIDLNMELMSTFEDVDQQLSEDKDRWGDTWKERGLSFNGQNQEQRWFNKMQDYYLDFIENGVPIPWTKVIGEAHIALVREKILK